MQITELPWKFIQNKVEIGESFKFRKMHFVLGRDACMKASLVSILTLLVNVYIFIIHLVETIKVQNWVKENLQINLPATHNKQQQKNDSFVISNAEAGNSFAILSVRFLSPGWSKNRYEKFEFG